MVQGAWGDTETMNADTKMIMQALILGSMVGEISPDIMFFNIWSIWFLWVWEGAYVFGRVHWGTGSHAGQTIIENKQNWKNQHTKLHVNRRAQTAKKADTTKLVKTTSTDHPQAQKESGTQK